MVEEVDFEGLKALMADRAGYVLGPERANAVEARLGPIARREGLSSVQALLQQLDPVTRPSLTWEVIETILPGDSRFFREREPFQLMCAQLLPTLTRARGGAVRILSAGCATGQEAWSAALCAAEVGTDAEVVGLDLSSRAIEKARAGVYTQFEVQRGLRSRQLITWFERSDDLWRVSDRLRTSVRFERANLIDGLQSFGRFDLIFCRHILTDMAPEARRGVLAALDAVLEPTGCLFLGGGEVIPEAQAAFRPVAGLKSVYVRGSPSVSRAA